jgi:ketosteroid isomerase-like protein
MSQENVEVVKRVIDAYNRRDLGGLETLTHPDVELDWSASRGFVVGVYRGFDEFQRFWTSYFDAFEEITAEPERFIDAGESVVVPNLAHMRGRDGIEVSARSAIVFTFRSHRIKRMCLYQETDEALKAAGLAE